MEHSPREGKGPSMKPPANLLLDIGSIQPIPNPLKWDVEELRLPSNPPFRNINCKHYTLCLDYVIYYKPHWTSFTCQGCSWKTNEENRPVLGEGSSLRVVGLDPFLKKCRQLKLYSVREVLDEATEKKQLTQGNKDKD